MSTKNFLLGATGTIFVVALLTGIIAALSARNHIVALEAAMRERARADMTMREAEVRITVAEKAQADAQAALDALRAEKPAPPAPAAPARASAPPAPNTRELLAKDPMLQALFVASSRARLAQEYGPFFASLNLTPAQIEQFNANAMKAQEQMVDLNSAAQAQGPESRQAVATLQKKVNDELLAAQSALLGPEAYQQLKDYERSGQARMAVDGLVGSATLEGMPLSAAQVAQLTSAIANATSRFPSGGRADLTTANWEAVEAQARQILSPAQFELFRSAAPINAGASRWYLQFDAAVARANQTDAARVPAPQPPTS